MCLACHGVAGLSRLIRRIGLNTESLRTCWRVRGGWPVGFLSMAKYKWARYIIVLHELVCSLLLGLAFVSVSNRIEDCLHSICVCFVALDCCTGLSARA